MEKINRLMIIDDDELNNYITTKIVGYAQLAKKIDSYQSPKEALDLLIENSKSPNGNTPELIFLDISMHGMNGWEFLDEYQKLPEDYKKRINIFILSTSIFDRDKLRASEYDFIKGYIQKPLTEPKIKEIKKIIKSSKGIVNHTLKTILNLLF